MIKRQTVKRPTCGAPMRRFGSERSEIRAADLPRPDSNRQRVRRIRGLRRVPGVLFHPKSCERAEKTSRKRPRAWPRDSHRRAVLTCHS